MHVVVVDVVDVVVVLLLAVEVVGVVEEEAPVEGAEAEEEEEVSKQQQQPLSKARPEFKSPAQFLLLPLDGVRRCPSFSTPVASLHERWCVFFP